jgi:hypothetical protein
VGLWGPTQGSQLETSGPGPYWGLIEDLLGAFRPGGCSRPPRIPPGLSRGGSRPPALENTQDPLSQQKVPLQKILAPQKTTMLSSTTFLKMRWDLTSCPAKLLSQPL